MSNRAGTTIGPFCLRIYKPKLETEVFLLVEKGLLSLFIVVLAIISSFFIQNIILLVTVWIIFALSIFNLFFEKDTKDKDA
ncbi:MULTISPECIES: hypothetical protein [unclassified Sporosarcina]|uniref:hypothetical protein n=1 Tax=unclassified Sporosarcina TaxID=2647733 RepID=UPI0011802677|nr:MULTISPECIES: hypothetical protein [unclassified Sporosarcina]